MVALEVHVGPVHFETADQGVAEDETLLVVQTECDRGPVQVFQGYCFEFEVEFLIEYRVVRVLFYLHNGTGTLVRWI